MSKHWNRSLIIILSFISLQIAYVYADNTQISVAKNSTEQWQQTLDRITNGIISIRVDGTRAFDTDSNQSTQATGFIVDKERGIILTNRHVVMPGPSVAEGVFLNNEEIELKPIYRDPVHDFGFYQYDPKQLRFIQPVELSLRPDKVRKSLDIRVVGNDAGEQLAILAGTLAKLDRKAPAYGRNSYNDFNTFYYQAASSTSGGSSGSPVLDIDGDVIALNAGASNRAASSFFLPLDRVVRALKLIQEKQPVTRGTIQTVFDHKPYDELRRLGLDLDTERAVRQAFPEQKGLLVVTQVLPESAASSELDPGDIVTHVNGRLFADFITLESILDKSIGSEIKLSIQRGDKKFTASIEVDDLHQLTARQYLEIGNGVVHTLSYQQARNFNVPVKGVYVASPGYMLGNAGIPRTAVIKRINNQPVDNLSEFVTEIKTLNDKEKVTVQYFNSTDVLNLKTHVMYMEHQWFPVQVCTRDDFAITRQGAWPCDAIEAKFEIEENDIQSTRFVNYDDKLVNALAPSLVMVNFDAPYLIKGVAETNYYGTGLVVDKDKGMVVVDRNTIPLTIGDVRLTFAGSLEVKGQVEYIHPIHNIAIVKYDPKLIGNTPIKNAQFDVRAVKPGEEVTVIGLQADHKILSQKTEVLSTDEWNSPLSSYFGFRETNVELISLVNPPASIDGVMVDKKGRILARWASFSFNGGGQLTRGIPANIILDAVKNASVNNLFSLEVELGSISLATARKRGLSQNWASKIEQHNPKNRRVLEIQRAVSGSNAKEKTKSGDLLLAIDGQTVSSFRDVEVATQKALVNLTLWRNSSLIEVSIETALLKGESIDRLVVWAGAYLHEPHRDLLAQRSMDKQGVYVAYYTFGSPATRYGLWAGRRIVEIDGQAINTLDDLVAQVRNKKHRDSVRIKTLAWNNQASVITLKLDTNFWPFYELVQKDNGWTRRNIRVE